ncbi:hypothetical protein J3Q64DRAFT_1706788 [Phycomyces blakesleeanus]|uniref:Velvet domain-containing protein n=1 Tax=Phycomyces blakesleeanus TaxID=4837 RepID=A0ABR3BBY4_PHYBL
MTLSALARQTYHSDIAEQENIKYRLVVRQQPRKARLCSFKEKVDRRPLDPPPIIQLVSLSGNHENHYTNPHVFLYATLATPEAQKDLNFVNGTRTTAGSMVQSLHKLKDIDDRDGGFFVFADVSVRLEGFFKLRFTLFEISGTHVHRLCSVLSDTFQVYSPKTFPGMSESTFLTRSFSDQGVRIRIRKETRVPHVLTKRRRTVKISFDSDDSIDRQSQGGDSVGSTAISPPSSIYQEMPSQRYNPLRRPTWPQTSSDPGIAYNGPPLPSPTQMLSTKEPNKMSMESLLLSDTNHSSVIDKNPFEIPSSSTIKSTTATDTPPPPLPPPGDGAAEAARLSGRRLPPLSIFQPSQSVVVGSGMNNSHPVPHQHQHQHQHQHPHPHSQSLPISLPLPMPLSLPLPLPVHPATKINPFQGNSSDSTRHSFQHNTPFVDHPLYYRDDNHHHQHSHHYYSSQTPPK